MHMTHDALMRSTLSQWAVMDAPAGAVTGCGVGCGAGCGWGFGVGFGCGLGVGLACGLLVGLGFGADTLAVLDGLVTITGLDIGAVVVCTAVAAVVGPDDTGCAFMYQGTRPSPVR